MILRFAIINAVTVFFGLGLLRLYLQTLSQELFIRDAIITLVVVITSSLSYWRARETSSFKLVVKDWPVFWSYFVPAMIELGYVPKCQMDDTYFFESRWLGESTVVSLKKLSDGHYILDFPKLARRPLQKKLSPYLIASDLTF